MKIRYTNHAYFQSMQDENISHVEIQAAIRKSERTVRITSRKYKFRYQSVEVVAQKEKGGWLIITCYRIK